MFFFYRLVIFMKTKQILLIFDNVKFFYNQLYYWIFEKFNGIGSMEIDLYFSIVCS